MSHHPAQCTRSFAISPTATARTALLVGHNPGVQDVFTVLIGQHLEFLDDTPPEDFGAA